jgi:hypothetical protein
MLCLILSYFKIKEDSHAILGVFFKLDIKGKKMPSIDLKGSYITIIFGILLSKISLRTYRIIFFRSIFSSSHSKD